MYWKTCEHPVHSSMNQEESTWNKQARKVAWKHFSFWFGLFNYVLHFTLTGKDSMKQVLQLPLLLTCVHYMLCSPWIQNFVKVAIRCGVGLKNTNNMELVKYKYCVRNFIWCIKMLHLVCSVHQKIMLSHF